MMRIGSHTILNCIYEFGVIITPEPVKYLFMSRADKAAARKEIIKLVGMFQPDHTPLYRLSWLMRTWEPELSDYALDAHITYLNKHGFITIVNDAWFGTPLTLISLTGKGMELICRISEETV